MLVPEAPVDENDLAMTRMDDVWAAGQMFFVEAEAEPHAMHRRSDEDFGRAIAAVNASKFLQQ